ncbi:hypothetical protein C7E18_03535 [Stenotrophomonas maltophilia]|nr:hypothetical protein C7E18_03535 [Stenotrophomonas maltophilia]
MSQGGAAKPRGVWRLMKWGPRFAAQSVGLRRECAAASHLVRQVAFFLPVRWGGGISSAHGVDRLKQC